MKDRLTFYHPTEELLNVTSHGFGLLLSVAALLALIYFSSTRGTGWHIFSFTVFGVSLVILYTASTLYHYVQEPALRYKLNVFDHAAIYILIAGSYTPFTLHVLEGSLGLALLGTVWTVALVGITFKLFFTGRFNKASTVAYVLMGWLAVFAIEPFVRNFDPAGVVWVFVGGFAYTLGAVFYGLKMIRFNHAIFHVFVLTGSICHFVAVLFYLLPNH
ncbi:MAG: hemolysin III family protein [Acidobacteriota bacterium]|nr:MAG: hemolysin III family protein [Acidobacteriota bacterium]